MNGVYEKLTYEGSMNKLLMLVGFNNTFYCVQSINNNTLQALVEFVIQPDGTWNKHIIYQISTGGVVALEIVPKYKRINQYHIKNG